MKDNFVNRPLKKKLNRQNMVSRIEKLEGKTAIKPSSATRIEDLSEITDEINAAVIRAIDVEAGVVRMIMSGEDIYDGETYNIHANLAGFNDAGQPTVWIDAQNGKLYGGEGNVGMDEDGYWIVLPAAYTDANEFKFVDSAGIRQGGLGAYIYGDDTLNLRLQVGGGVDFSGPAYLDIQANTTGFNDASLNLWATGAGGDTGIFMLSRADFLLTEMDFLADGFAFYSGVYVDGGIGVDGDVQITGSAKVGDGNFFGATPTALADDTAISFSPTKLFGILCLNMRTAATGESGLFAYRCSGSGARMEIISAGSHIETTTGVLSGTTGTDGKLTLSAHTDGNIYIENRRGAGRSFTYTLLGA